MNRRLSREGAPHSKPVKAPASLKARWIYSSRPSESAYLPMAIPLFLASCDDFQSFIFIRSLLSLPYPVVTNYLVSPRIPCFYYCSRTWHVSSHNLAGTHTFSCHHLPDWVAIRSFRSNNHEPGRKILHRNWRWYRLRAGRPRQSMRIIDGIIRPRDQNLARLTWPPHLRAIDQRHLECSSQHNQSLSSRIRRQTGGCERAWIRFYLFFMCDRFRWEACCCY